MKDRDSEDSNPSRSESVNDQDEVRRASIGQSTSFARGSDYLSIVNSQGTQEQQDTTAFGSPIINRSPEHRREEQKQRQPLRVSTQMQVLEEASGDQEYADHRLQDQQAFHDSYLHGSHFDHLNDSEPSSPELQSPIDDKEELFTEDGVPFQRRMTFLKSAAQSLNSPLPLYKGGIRGTEPSSNFDEKRKSLQRLINHKQTKLEEQRQSSAMLTTEPKKKKKNKGKKRKKSETSVSVEEEMIPAKDCKHLRVNQVDGSCKTCVTKIPQYGSILDTGTVKSLIKVVFVDESKKQPTSPRVKPSDTQTNVLLEAGEAGSANSTILMNTSPQKSFAYVAPQSPSIIPYQRMQQIYESFTPENTHVMREYMLYVIIRNVRRMLKHRIITQSIFDKFSLFSGFGQPELQSEELKEYLYKQKRAKKVLDHDLLRFDSAIESGNLDRVETFAATQKYVDQQKMSKQQMFQRYNLFCKVDTNTKGHQQWFYFRVKNTRKNTKYQFSICNFTKPFSLFKQGMQVQMLSKRHQTLHVGNLQKKVQEEVSEDQEDADLRLFREKGLVTFQWQTVGTKIEYQKSRLQREGWSIPGPLNLDDEEEDNVEQDDLVGIGNSAGPGEEMYRKRYFYEMNFEVEFPYDDDTVYLAYSRPYPYTEIIAHMLQAEERLMKLPLPSGKGKEQATRQKDFNLKLNRSTVIYERGLLCRTICGLPVPQISITASKAYAQASFRNRKVIYVTARVHPGETNASSVFEGFFDKITQNTADSPILANFIVRLVPCMNPDGVVCGNYRSSLAGVDLNRQWILPNKELHPEVYHTKAQLHQLTKVENKKVLIYCDIHCHSKKKNSFLYGCNTAAEGAPFSTWTHVRLLPRLLAKRSQYISLPSCRFGIDACKVGTARVVIWKEFQVMNSFTLENSFFGYDYGTNVRIYTQDNYKEIGGALYLAFNDYRVCLQQINQEMVQSKGWLKPMKLKEITGTPAAEVVAKELKEQQQKKRREYFIKKYEERLAKERLEKGFSFAKEHDHLKQNGGNLNRKLTLTKEGALTASADPKNKPKVTTQRQVEIKSPEKLQKEPQTALLREPYKDNFDNIASQLDMRVPAITTTIVHQGSSNQKIKEESKLTYGHSKLTKQEYVSTLKTRESAQTLFGYDIDEQSKMRRSSVEEQSIQEVRTPLPNMKEPKIKTGRESSTLQRMEKASIGSDTDAYENEYVDQFGESCPNIVREVNPLKVKDWRQLFNQEELNRAYQQSIVGFESLAKDFTGQIEAPYNTLDTRSSQDKFSEQDISDDDASVDNLQPKHLYSQVYMKKDDAVEKAMRQTSRAQNNFIQEVKILITKRSHKDVKASQGADRKNSQEMERKDFWERANEASSQAVESGLNKELTHRAVNLKLTGVHIENPNRNQQVSQMTPISVKRDYFPQQVPISSNRNSSRATAKGPYEMQPVGFANQAVASTSSDQKRRQSAVKIKQRVLNQKDPHNSAEGGIQLVYPRSTTDRQLLQSMILKEQPHKLQQMVEQPSLQGILISNKVGIKQEKGGVKRNFNIAIPSHVSNALASNSSEEYSPSPSRKMVYNDANIADSQTELVIDTVKHSRALKSKIEIDQASVKKRQAYVMQVKAKDAKQAIGFKVEHLKMTKELDSKMIHRKGHADDCTCNQVEPQQPKQKAPMHQFILQTPGKEDVPPSKRSQRKDMDGKVIKGAPLVVKQAHLNQMQDNIEALRSRKPKIAKRKRYDAENLGETLERAGNSSDEFITLQIQDQKPRAVLEMERGSNHKKVKKSKNHGQNDTVGKRKRPKQSPRHADGQLQKSSFSPSPLVGQMSPPVLDLKKSRKQHLDTPLNQMIPPYASMDARLETDGMGETKYMDSSRLLQSLDNRQKVLSTITKTESRGELHTGQSSQKRLDTILQHQRVFPSNGGGSRQSSTDSYHLQKQQLLKLKTTKQTSSQSRRYPGTPSLDNEDIAHLGHPSESGGIGSRKNSQKANIQIGKIVINQKTDGEVRQYVTQKNSQADSLVRYTQSQQELPKEILNNGTKSRGESSLSRQQLQTQQRQPQRQGSSLFSKFVNNTEGDQYAPVSRNDLVIATDHQPDKARGSLTNTVTNVSQSVLADRNSQAQRRGDHFKMYLAMNMHSVQNQAVKETYQRQINNQRQPKDNPHHHKVNSQASAGLMGGRSSSMAHSVKSIYQNGEHHESASSLSQGKLRVRDGMQSLKHATQAQRHPKLHPVTRNPNNQGVTRATTNKMKVSFATVPGKHQIIIETPSRAPLDSVLDNSRRDSQNNQMRSYGLEARVVDNQQSRQVVASLNFEKGALPMIAARTDVQMISQPKGSLVSSIRHSTYALEKQSQGSRVSRDYLLGSSDIDSSMIEGEKTFVNINILHVANGSLSPNRQQPNRPAKLKKMVMTDKLRNRQKDYNQEKQIQLKSLLQNEIPQIGQSTAANNLVHQHNSKHEDTSLPQLGNAASFVSSQHQDISERHSLQPLNTKPRVQKHYMNNPSSVRQSAEHSPNRNRMIRDLIRQKR